MALSDKDIVITPNRGQASDPKIEFKGASAAVGAQTITLNVYPTNSGTISFEGSAGQLFSITNSLTGTIYSVNDVSGIPSIEVLDTGLIKLAQYSGNVLIGTNTDNGNKLRVAGSSHINQLGVGTSNNQSFDFYNNGTSYFNGSVTIDDTAAFTAGNQLQFYTSSGQLRGYINATDNDDNHFQIATSGGEDIVFKDAGLSGTRNLVIRGGNTGTLAYGAMRSPLFTEIDNTSHYLDMSVTGGTILSTGSSADTLGYNASYGIYIGGIDGRYLYSGNSSYTGPLFWNGSAAYVVYHTGNVPAWLTAESDTLATVTSRGASTSTSVTLSGGGNQFQGHFYYLPYDSAGNHYPHFNDGGNGTGVQVNWRLYTGASNTQTHVWRTDYTYFANRVESAGDMRATSFADASDTNYYVDPANTLKSAVLNGNVEITPRSSTWAEGIQFYMPDQSTWGGLRWVRNRSNYHGSWYIGWTALDSTNDLVFGTNASGTQVDNILRLYNSASGSALISRDLYLSGSTGGNYGNRLIIGNTDTSYTIQDGNLRPTLQLHGQYPVVSLNHTVTSNTSHGPTLQFTNNGVGNQFVIGTNGSGTFLSMGYSSNANWNPHNGIAGYEGTSFFHAGSDGMLGLGSPGDWGGLGAGVPVYHLHVKGFNNAVNGYAGVFENIISASNNGGGWLFQNNHANHSWGVVSELRVASGDSGTDRPSLLFSTPFADVSWSVGFVTGTDNNFRIVKNHGHRSYYGGWAGNNSGWGTEYLRVTTDGSVISTVEVQAPIFKDSNDSNYYGDFASTSQLYALNTRLLAVNPDGNTANPDTGTLSLWTNPASTTSTLMFKRTDQLFGTHGGVTDTYATYWNMDSTNRGWIFRYATSTTAGDNVFSIRNNDGTTTIGTGGFTAGSVHARLNIHAGSSSGATTFRDIDLFGGWSGGEGHAITATHGTSSSNIVGQMVFEHNSPGSRIKWGRLYHSGDQSTYPMHLISDSSSAYLEMNTGSMRAPIFYEYNDTGYYADPSGTSILNYAYGLVSTFTAPGSPGTYVWVRAPLGAFNGGGNIVKFSISRSIYDNGSSPYGGPSADFTVFSREWHGGQDFCMVIYGEHGSASGTGGKYIANAGPKDEAGGGYWFYMKLEGGIDYIMRRDVSSGFIGTFSSTTDPTGIPTIYAAGLNLMYTQGPSANLSVVGGSIYAPFFVSTANNNYYLAPSSNSTLSQLTLGVTGSTDVTLGINGPTHISSSNPLYFGGNIGSYNSWASKIYTSGSTTVFSAQGWQFNGEGYVGGPPVYFSIDNAGIATATGELRAPIFKDSNNTDYFLDPTSTTSLRTVGSWRSDSSTWDGEFAGKIQYHSSNWYLQAAGSWLFRNAAGTNVAEIANDGSLYTTNIYNSNWFRNNNSAQGLYNTANDAHFYSAGPNYWHINGNSGDITDGGLVFYNQYNSSQGNATGRKGYVYWDSAGFGLLDSTGNWTFNVHPTNYKRVTIGGANYLNPYNAVDGIRLMFGGSDDNAADNYYIGTNLENYGGNYTKLDLRWHTGIRMGAQPNYGGVRIYDSEDLGTIRFSVNKGDANTRVESGDFYAANLYARDDSNYYLKPADSTFSLRVRGPITAGSGGPLGGGRLELYGSYGSITIRPNEGSTFASIRYGSGINFQNSSASTTYLSIDDSGNGTFLGTVTTTGTQTTTGNTNVSLTKAYSVPNIGTTAATTIFAFNINTYRSAKLLIQITQGTNYQVSEAVVIHNGTNAFFTEYGVVETNGTLGTISCTVNTGTSECVVSINMISAATTIVTTHGTLMLAIASGGGGGGTTGL